MTSRTNWGLLHLGIEDSSLDGGVVLHLNEDAVTAWGWKAVRKTDGVGVGILVGAGWVRHAGHVGHIGHGVGWRWISDHDCGHSGGAVGKTEGIA